MTCVVFHCRFFVFLPLSTDHVSLTLLFTINVPSLSLVANHVHLPLLTLQCRSMLKETTVALFIQSKRLIKYVKPASIYVLTGHTIHTGYIESYLASSFDFVDCYLLKNGCMFYLVTFPFPRRVRANDLSGNLPERSERKRRCGAGRNRAHCGGERRGPEQRTGDVRKIPEIYV